LLFVVLLLARSRGRFLFVCFVRVLFRFGAVMAEKWHQHHGRSANGQEQKQQRELFHLSVVWAASSNWPRACCDSMSASRRERAVEAYSTCALSSARRSDSPALKRLSADCNCFSCEARRDSAVCNFFRAPR